MSVSIVDSYKIPGHVTTPFPPTLEQQDLMSDGRPIYKFDVVAMPFWQRANDEDGKKLQAVQLFGPATNSFDVLWHSAPLFFVICDGIASLSA
jgi:hypothetical protein